jgi:hypothetical protein
VIGEYFPFVSVIIFVVVVIAGYAGILIKLLKKSFVTADIDDNSGKGL